MPRQRQMQSMAELLTQPLRVHPNNSCKMCYILRNLSPAEQAFTEEALSRPHPEPTPKRRFFFSNARVALAIEAVSGTSITAVAIGTHRRQCLHEEGDQRAPARLPHT